MSNKKTQRNEHPLWVDIVKQFLDEYGRETILKILDIVLPASVKEWMAKDKVRRAAIGSALTAASIGASRIIPDSPFGVVAEEAVREVVATLKDYLNGATEGESAEKIAEKISPQTRETIRAVEAVVRLGAGDLPLEEARNLASFISHVKADKGVEISHKAILLLDKMDFKNLLRFSKLALQEQMAEFESRVWQKPDEPKPPKADGPGFIARQRAALVEAQSALKEKLEQARAKRVANSGKLSAAWSRFIGKEVAIADSDIADEAYLLDNPKLENRVAVPIIDDEEDEEETK